ncbi:hypothetical protein ACPOL_0122 [Acidisarcina polymorpha]|uniref:Uncharacterized protein n=1 Tax=Acidisarcina polymorpha TaxID=2211140 RepID=A0A2Z5FS08_9BACT|nr:hypothetical protein [Acidisarcina polymorpha]AXC09509.1 hypothetical protein ACPOL_0122 [Acidisarcina polymorpha]
MPVLDGISLGGSLARLEKDHARSVDTRDPADAFTRRWRFTSSRLPTCSNAACSSGWLRLWRGRQVPVFEGGWVCGPQCSKLVVGNAIARELKGWDQAVNVHCHRIPLGLVLLSQGAITRDQLRGALARQRTCGGRIGAVLQLDQEVTERMITRALGAQWGCPVLTLEDYSPDLMATFSPRLLLDAFGFLPLRVAGSALLYLGFEDRIDRSVSFALERMTGLRVAAGVVDGRAFAAAHRRILESAFPPARLVEAAGMNALIGTFTRILEETKPIDARIVRMHDYFWMRMWKRTDGSLKRAGCLAPIEDVLGSLAETGL